MDYTSALKKLKRQELAPRAGLWVRIEDTLAGRTAAPLRQYRLVLAAAVLTLVVTLAFAGAEYYERYRLEQYLNGVCEFPAEFDTGTFL